MIGMIIYGDHAVAYPGGKDAKARNNRILDRPIAFLHLLRMLSKHQKVTVQYLLRYCTVTF